VAVRPRDRNARPECGWITRALEQTAQSHAIALVVPEHVAEVRGRRLTWIEKTRAAVKGRLTKEITYWDHRAEQLKVQEQAGKSGARLNSHEARLRVDDLQHGSRSALPSWTARPRSQRCRP
jgi:6-phosphofructokinase